MSGAVERDPGGMLDAVLAVAEQWQRAVIDDPRIAEDHELAVAAARIGDAVGAFYQLAGRRLLPCV